MSEHDFHFELPESYSRMLASIAEALQPTIEQQEKLRSILQSVPIPTVVPISPELKDAIETSTERYQNLAREIQQSTLLSTSTELEQKIQSLTSGLASSFSYYDQSITRALDLWHECQRELHDSISQTQEALARGVEQLLAHADEIPVWGRYGWTLSPFARVADYYNPPSSKEEADERMRKIHNQAAKKAVIEELLHCSYHQGHDIEEAVSLYHAEHYKSCALILFSLIDALLIHTQDCTSYSENRKQGNGGIKRFCEIQAPSNDKITFRLLQFSICVYALDAFFESTSNFGNSNPVLNRHLLCHGMLQRDVTQNDCDQLFLLYENMLSFTGNLE